MKILLTVLALTTVVMSDSNVRQLLKEGNDHFTAKMTTEVIRAQPGKSFVLSAFSVLSPLAQLTLASVGPSHDELLSTIGMPNDDAIKEAFSGANTRISLIKGVELKQATKVYVRNGYVLNNEFATVSKNVFKSELQNINFEKSQEAANEMNKWVEDHTNKRIKDLVDPNTIDEDTAAVLVNALYFKGKWKTPFEKSSTQDSDFFLTNDNKVTVPMMHQSDLFKYGESRELDAKLLEMPYEGDEASFVVVLPNQRDGIDSLMEKLKESTAFTNAFKTMNFADVHVTLPKYKIETTTNLKEVLKKMNIAKLFDEKLARLEKLIIGESTLYVSDATQKVFIEVSEEGVEAAAGNEFGIAVGYSLRIPQYKTFNADHPFAFFLMEKDNILFSGVYRS